MSGKNTRKLLSETILADLLYKSDLGVPHSKLIRDMNLDVSLPHLTKLIGWYKQSEEAEVNAHFIRASLFPPWIVENINGMQCQPDTYTYKGLFPFGEWKRI